MGAGQELGLRSIPHRSPLLLLPPRGEEESTLTLLPLLHWPKCLQSCFSHLLTPLSLWLQLLLGRASSPSLSMLSQRLYHWSWWAQPWTGAGPPRAVWQCSTGHREASGIFSHVASSLQKPCHTNTTQSSPISAHNMKGEILAPRRSQERQTSNPMPQQTSFLECITRVTHAEPTRNGSKLFSNTCAVKLARKQRYPLHFMDSLVIIFHDPMIHHFFFFLTLSYAYSKKLLNKKSWTSRTYPHKQDHSIQISVTSNKKKFFCFS